MFNPNDPLFWVLIAFLAFVGLLIYYRVPTSVGKMLDDRADVIRKELDEARKLREDAQSLLADYQRKAREADAEAQTIIEQAKREAELLAVDARKALAESLERRSKIAEEKIARAEAQALSEVRATAVETALAAAREILKTRAGGATGDTLISQSITISGASSTNSGALRKQQSHARAWLFFTRTSCAGSGLGNQPEPDALLLNPTTSSNSPGRDPSGIGNVIVRTVEK